MAQRSGKGRVNGGEQETAAFNASPRILTEVRRGACRTRYLGDTSQMQHMVMETLGLARELVRSLSPVLIVVRKGGSGTNSQFGDVTLERTRPRPADPAHPLPSAL